MEAPWDGLLRTAAYRVIVSDPPWKFEDAGSRMAPSYSGNGRKEARYETMELGDIGALPVRSLAHPEGCWLVLWVPWSMLRHGLTVAKHWGFEYVTGGEWVKTSSKPKGPADVRIGGGHYFRMASEPYLLFRCGKKWPRAKRHDVPNVIFATRSTHSRKPDLMLERIEQLWDGPYCELFGRRRREGWDCWGDQLEVQISEEVRNV